MIASGPRLRRRWGHGRWILRQALLGLGAIGAGLGPISCASRHGTVSGEHDITLDIAGLETSLAIRPDRIAEGEVASLVLTLWNGSDRDLRISFPDRRQVGLVIRTWHGGVYATDQHTVTLPRQVSLGPLESWERRVEWDGTIDAGGGRMPLPPGKYELEVGLRRAGEIFVNRSNRVAITMMERAGD